MNKKIIIGSLFVALLLVLLPSTNAIKLNALGSLSEEEPSLIDIIVSFFQSFLFSIFGIGQDDADENEESEEGNILCENPSILVEKEADVAEAEVGDTLTYTYTVTNDGDLDLGYVTVVDDLLGPVPMDANFLEPGDVATGSLSYTVQGSDLPGPIVNVVVANGTPHDYTYDITDEDTETVQLIIPDEPSIYLDKQADVAEAEVGDTITYTYTVTNDGDVSLCDVNVQDDLLGGVTLGSTCLAPGESTSGSLTYTVQEGDLPGPIVNIAIATGYVVDVLCEVTYQDSESVDLIQPTVPSIHLDKQADLVEAEVGEIITYTYIVTNDGDVDLYNVNVQDDKLGSVPLEETYLEPDESVTGTLTYTVQEGDLPGPIVNIAIATGYVVDVLCEVTYQDSESVDLIEPSNPSICLVKEADVAEAEVGDTVTYTYTVTNDGDVDLSDVFVEDDMLGSVPLGSTFLLPGESTTGSLTYIVKESDLPGPIVNVAVANGSYCLSRCCGYVESTDDESVDVYGGQPGIKIIKKADTNLAEVGDTITYMYYVYNTGDLTLYDVFCLDEPLGEVTLNLTTLSPGEWAYGELTYTVQGTDLPGPLQNLGYANATTATGEEVEDHMVLSIDLLTPCSEDVWVDRSWNSQLDVNDFNSDLTWQVDAFKEIDNAIDAVCVCGTVHVRPGTYYGQILIDKSLSLVAEGEVQIIGNSMQEFSVDGSAQKYKPIIFAYGGNLVGTNVVSAEKISVTVDGFDIGGDSGSIAVMYHNVQTGCVPALITNNYIQGVGIGIVISGCSNDTTITWNVITWPAHTIDRISILIESLSDCGPDGVEAHHNKFGVECGNNIGIWNKVGNIVNAEYNWWGADDGPSSPNSEDTYDAVTGRIADGYGDEVIGLVHFDPWAGVESSGVVEDVGFAIKYDASDSFGYSLDGTALELSYWWDFGDNHYSDSKIIYRNYAEGGTYQVSLRISAIDPELDPSGFLRDWSYYTITQ